METLMIFLTKTLNKWKKQEKYNQAISSRESSNTTIMEMTLMRSPQKELKLLPKNLSV
jgi:hypothetical protein